MKPNFDHWTVVLSGQWNTRIFAPDWVIANLSQGETVKAEVVLIPGSANFRLHWDGLVLIPQNHQIVIGVKDESESSLQKAEELAIKILGLLPHTPLHGCGINFKFEDTDPPGEMFDLFRLSDQDKISDLEALIKSTEIKRQLRFPNEDHVLNLACTSEEGRVSLHFNYHFDVNSTKVAAEILPGNAVKFKASSLKIMESVYNLTVETEENNDG